MTESLGLWVTIIACGAATFLLRFSFIALQDRIRVPKWFTQALIFVPIAVLSAIILPEILFYTGELSLSPLNPRLLAAIIATIVAWRTKNVTVTIVIGMLSLWGLQYVLQLAGLL